MTDTSGSQELFPLDITDPNTAIELRKTGILSHRQLAAMVRAKTIRSLSGIDADQIQPASIDLRLGKQAYRVRASFLPGVRSTVLERVEQLDGLPAIDLTAPGGAVFERNAVYVAEIQESVLLNSETEGIANPKSSTGRLDVLTRLITDYGTAFDRIEPGYKGPLYIEIAPLSFSIVVREGTRLSQLRLQRGTPVMPTGTVEKYYSEGQLVGLPTPPADLLPLRAGGLVPVTVDLVGQRGAKVVGYKARKNSNKIDVDRIGYYNPEEFWHKIEDTGGQLNLDQDDFYILATREDVGVPKQLAAEMVPYDTRSGEFRVHYAGFFDPGFGWVNGKAAGSKAVLEVRSYGVSFTLEHGQIVGWLRYGPISTGFTDKLYGVDVKSNYQGQGVALAKQFKKWPGT